MLLKGGTSIIVALESVSNLLDLSLQNKMKQASNALWLGQTISQAMDQAGFTTPIALLMLFVGERGGKIGYMIERIAAFYDVKLARWID